MYYSGIIFWFFDNTCGKIGYGIPTKDECKEDGEVCCYVKISDGTNNKAFCVSAPSIIKPDDVKDEIKTYTSYNLEELVCNKACFMKNVYMVLLLILFIFI